jgi:Flp pilus assembly protein TadG
MLSKWRGDKPKKKSLGQSIVEFAVLLPILLMMLSGLIEFGFMLNYYLDIIDAARESARFAANGDPLYDENGNFIDPNCQYYLNAQQIAQQSINLGSGGQITLNPATDDVIISVYSALDNGTVDERWPQNTAGCSGLLHVRSGEVSLNDTRTSGLDTMTDIEGKLSSSAPNTGLVSVEIYYDYHMILGLPWITAFVPDPVTLWAYSIMPNVYAEPTPTPTT